MSRSSTLATSMMLCFLAPARAEIITVTSDSGGTGGPDCTLRDAITAANTDTATGGCPAGNGTDTIELPVGATISLTEADNETEGPNGLPSVISEITINGNGATIQREETAPAFRIVHLSFSGQLTLNGVSISGGDVSSMSLGGGIRNSGMLTLFSSIVSGNTAVGAGGIMNSGILTLTNSIISENSTSGSSGGGIVNYGSGTVVLTNSTVSANSAGGPGGGIRNLGTLSLFDSTVSGNSTSHPHSHDGISNLGTLTIINSTVSGHAGWSLANIIGTIMLTNSNVSDNSAGIHNYDTVILTTSNVSNNSFDGIRNEAAMTLVNSTVTGNRIGVRNLGTVTLTDATICGNIIEQISGDYTDGGGNLIADECPPCPAADFDGDGFVNAADLAQLLGSWGPCADPCEPGDPGETCSADFDGDCDVGASDLAQLLGSWGPCP